MAVTAWIVLLVLWAGWLVQAVLSAMQVRKFARRFDRPAREDYAGYQPKAAVIVPFKGTEPGLAENLRGLFEQDYPEYRLVLVVESDDDPAAPLLREAIARDSHRQAELIVAGVAGPREGQKVHNQLAALRHLRDRAAGEAVWVFADSDAVPGPGWLGELVGPLVLDKTAVTTGYRWMIPRAKPGEDRPRLAAHLASVLNSSVACFLGRDEHNHAWGGSMALRVDTAEELDLVGRLEGTLSDDYTVSRLAKESGRRIYFVSGCLVASPVDFDFPGLIEFAVRQHRITRVHAPGLWVGGILLHALYLLGLASLWAGLIWGLVARPGGWVWPVAAGVLLAGFVAGQVRAGYRRRVVRKAFGGEVVEKLRTALLLDRWAKPAWMMLHAGILVRAGLSRTICWRGVRYHMRGPDRVERLEAGG